MVVPDRLLLDDHAALGEPRIVCAGIGELMSPLHPGRRPSPASTPPRLLLNAEIPYVPGVRTVPQEHDLLLGSRLKAVLGHKKIISENINQGGNISTISNDDRSVNPSGEPREDEGNAS
jgi:hypothetical protein